MHDEPPISPMDILALIGELITKYHGWRFYLPVLGIGCLAAAFHFTVGWTELRTTLVVLLALVGTLSGILWQHLHENH